MKNYIFYFFLIVKSDFLCSSEDLISDLPVAASTQVSFPKDVLPNFSDSIPDKESERRRSSSIFNQSGTNFSASLWSPFADRDSRRGRKRNSLTCGSLVESPLKGLAPKPITIRILSMDGGGVRGIMLAYFLMCLERHFETSVQNLFHYVAGTSAGGILATAMSLNSKDDPTKPMFTAKDLVEILRKESGNLFQTRYRSIGGLLGPKYRNPLKIFQRLVGPDTPFEGGPLRTMVTTYDVEAKSIKTITNFPSRDVEKQKFEVFTAADTMRATSAAPTFYAPHMCKPIKNERSDRYVLVDGGIGANNPSRIILQEVLRTYPGAEILMVSLGTGRKTSVIRYKDIAQAGTIKWVNLGLIDQLMSAPNALVVEEIANLFEQDSNNQQFIKGIYSRFDPHVVDDSMDNTKEFNLRSLIQSMRSEIDEAGSPWHNLVRAFESRPFQPLPPLGTP